AAPGPRPTHVEVRNLVDDALVARFRWSFTAGAQTVRDEGLFGVADLPLPIGVPGVLLVEADGMEPLRQEAVTATAAPQPALQLRLYLRPTRPAAGITVLVRDNVGQPVDNLRVDAFSLGDSARGEQWQLGRPLWSRRASAEDGRYQLPPLPAGAYGVQLRATDADGVLRPLQSWTRPFTLTGDNGFVEDVTLQPGCALRLELVDASGAPLDPAARGSLRVPLRSGDARPQPRKWTGLSTDGRAVSAIDEAPTRSPIWLADPAAPGSHTLEVRSGDALLARQAVQLGPIAQIVRATVY
ncbi:MAG: hypothetical protein VXY92_00790, partial [Planctomycetota bacterium]|nr:hypothetical protein [Planctomycetota bacterium]